MATSQIGIVVPEASTVHTKVTFLESVTGTVRLWRGSKSVTLGEAAEKKALKINVLLL